MFTRIAYDVTFPTGRHIKREHQLHEGMGAIVGANEQGKSLVLEFMRFLVFGSKALRGPSSDYTQLKVDGDLVIGDQTYRIERTISNAKLILDGEVVARGTTPVNQRLMAEFGFGLNTFDVSNAIMQGEVEAFAKLGPMGRQKLVDGVVGLDKIETLAKFAGDKALGFEREAKAIQSVLIAPERPVEPEGWPNRGAIQDFLRLAEQHQLELAKIDGELAGLTLSQPVEPEAMVFAATKEQLEAAVVAQRELNGVVGQLRALLPEIDLADARAKIEAWKAYDNAQRILRDTPAPQFTREELERWHSDWGVIAEHEEEGRKARERRRLQELLDTAQRVDCPNCDHNFALDIDRVIELQTQLAAVEAHPVSADKPPYPPINERQIAYEIENWPRSEERIRIRTEAEAVPFAEMPMILDLTHYEADMARRPELQLQKEALECKILPIDAEAELLRLMRWEMEQERYEADYKRWRAQEERRAELNEARGERAYAPARVAELRPIVARFEPYAQALQKFEQDQLSYELRLAQAQDLLTKAQKWRSAKDALGVLRGLIKTHLYPSLAQAASVLLAGMTGGQRRRIDIDEDFNVMVDGQRLDSLSGSGKACANLAIRLGLGQVLTHRAFPVILADEIDASMDDFRAGKTADILQQCAKRVRQLILVSHKKPEADWYIDLGGTSEQPAAA